MKITLLSNYDLLEEYEYAIKRMHYDPIDSREPEFSADELRMEVERRMKE